jgi:molybdopterin converting factor subunit 1
MNAVVRLPARHGDRPLSIRVKLFAVVRERSGVGELDLDLPPHSTLAAASDELARRFPQIADLLPRVAYAVNLSYAPPSTVLNDGDELAVIPPVSGG